jgi:hypothetical protein
MVHLGDSSKNLWHSWFDGIRWSENAPIEGQQSKAAPALATFEDQLHMVHLGESSNNIWHSRFDGSDWSPNVQVPRHSSKASPALAVYFGLTMAHIGDESNSIWVSYYSNGEWTEDHTLGGSFDHEQRSKAPPGLAATPSLPNGGNRPSRLNMVHLGDTNNDLWYSHEYYLPPQSAPSADAPSGAIPRNVVGNDPLA